MYYTDISGPVVAEPGAPGYVGAVAHTWASAALTAILVALGAVLDRIPQSVLLRIPSQTAAALVTGVWDPSAVICRADDRLPPLERQLISEVRRLFATLRDVTEGRLWVTTFLVDPPGPLGPSVWAQRAAALAHYGQTGWRSSPAFARPAAWQGVSDATAFASTAGYSQDCPVCLEPYDEDLPSPSALSRSPPGTWRCTHSVCRGCRDAMSIAGAQANQRCPLCRQPPTPSLRFELISR